MLWKFFEDTGLSGHIKLELSSLGDEKCRPRYKEELVDFFTPYRDDLCEDCRRRLETNPLRILDCKEKGCKKIAQNAPVMIENLCSECSAHFEEVKERLDSVGVSFIVNPRIVRGLDYYTRTVFEVTTEQLGAQNAVAAGGRYDGLVEELGGPATPAVGFAIGMERLILLQQQTIPEGFGKQVQVFIAHLGDEARQKSFEIAFELRSRGIATEIDYGSRSLKSQLKRADKSGAFYTFILGEDELGRGMIKLRNMAESTEEEISIQDALSIPIDE
jgi:histidyl-tRNA synthetase